jgi:syntaxin-binding protein 5
MFKTIGRSLTDLSTDLRERQDWEVGTLRALNHLLNASTFAFDPVSSILAIGEYGGTVLVSRLY